MDYQLIMHLPCRCVQRVYSVFINLKVHTAQNLAVRANSVNTCLNIFFSCACRFIPRINPGGTKCHSESQIRWNSGKRVQRKSISLNPLVVFLIRELVNFANIFTVFYFCEVCFAMLQIQSPQGTVVMPFFS